MLSRFTRSATRVIPQVVPRLSAVKASQFNVSARFFSVDVDSDAAFKSIKKQPVETPGLSSELEQQLREAVQSSKIVLFMKGVPSAPQCGFSNRVVQILTHLSTFSSFRFLFSSLPSCSFIFFIFIAHLKQHVLDYFLLLDVPYEACNVLESPELREGIKVFSDWPTIPQLYVDGEFVGGCDIVTNMFTSGELHELLGMKKE